MSSGVPYYEFDVKMTCSGCSGAVTRALSKLEGLESYEVSLEKERVVVHPKTATYDDVLQKISKTGKEVRSGKIVDKADDEPAPAHDKTAPTDETAPAEKPAPVELSAVGPSAV